MAYLVPGSGGLSFVAASSSAEENNYDPVYGEALDLNFIWDSLPDFYTKYMVGTQYMTSVWNGVAQVLSSDLLHLYETDYAKSIKDIPFASQRKWFKLNLETTLDLDTDPQFAYYAQKDFRHTSNYIEAAFTMRNGVASRYYRRLQGTTTEEGALVWHADFTIPSADNGSVALFGYSKYNAVNLESTLATGVYTNGGNRYLAIVHGTSATAAAATAIGAVSLSLSTSYRVRAEYSPTTSIVTATATELRKQRVSSSAGYTESSTDLTTATLFDSTQDFVASGVQVGDFIVFDGIDHEVVTVSTTYLVVSFASLPSSATGMSYTVVGPSEVDSISLNLLTESSRSFSVDSFGLISGEMYQLRDLTVVMRAKLVANVDELYFIDPSVAQTLIELPKLQTSPTATPTKEAVTDYLVYPGQVSFNTPTTGEWYGEFGLFDESRVYNNFGANVPLTKEVSSEDYLNKVRGLHYALYNGPTISSIRTGVLASIGLPLAIEGGTVTQINTAYSGERGQIVVAGRSYLYPLSVGTSLSVSDVVGQFDPLCDGVLIKDYISDPTWFDSFSFLKEVQKYHTFLVSIDLDAFDSSSIGAAEAISQASTVLDLIKPTYKDVLLVGSRDLTDSESLSDSILLSPTLIIADAMSEPYPVYDDKRFFPPAYDWAYDQGQTEWEEIPASVAYFAYQETQTKPWNGTSSQSKFLTGGTVEIVEGQTFITDASGQYISELGRVCSVINTGGSTDSSASIIFTGDASERFLNSIPNSSGTMPTGMSAVVVISDGSSNYAVLPITAINSNTELQTSTTTAGLKGLSGLTYEVRVTGPVGTVYVQDLSGAGSTSGTTFTSTGSPAFETAIPNGGGSPKVPKRPTYVFVDPFQEDADDYLRKVTQIDSNTQLTVASAFAGTLSSKNYIVFNPRTAIAASPGVASTAGTTTTNTFVATSSTAVITASTTGVVDSVGLEDSAGSNLFNTKANGNISAGFGLAVSGSGAGLDGNYVITGLFLDTNNYIKTNPAFGATGSVASYTVYRGAFQDVSTGDLFVVESGANTGIYTITGTSSSSPEKGLDTITISGSFPSAVATTGYVYKIADIWARVAHVDSDTKIYTTTAWGGDGKDSTSDPGGGTGANTVSYAEEVEYAFLSEVDLKALEVFYDQAEELSPDEDVQLRWTPTVGYGGELLHDASSHLIFTTDGSNTDEIDHTNALTSTAPSANDVIILPNGRAREVSSYTAGPPGTITLVGTNSAQDDAGSDFTSAALYLIPAASVATAGTSFTFSNGSANVVVAGSLSGATLSPGDLIQPLLPSGSGDNTTDLPVVEIATVPGSYPGTITLTSNYTGDGIVTTKVVVRDTSNMATDLGSYFDLTSADFHNVEVPGADQTMAYTIPENTFL